MSTRGKGLLGVKIGMTSIFTEDGDQLPVTVVKAGPNVVLSKTPLPNPAEDGVNVRLGFGEKREKLFNKPELGFFKKAGVAPTRWMKEFRWKEADVADLEVGATVGVETFEMGQFVDVTGTSKGKGFAGVVKKYKMRGQGPRGSHGTHEAHRNVGSIGQRKSPGRVFPGKRMPGRMGGETVTVRNLEVVGIDEEQQLLLIRGAIPGHKDDMLMLRPALRIAKTADQPAEKKPVNPMKASKGRG